MLVSTAITLNFIFRGGMSIASRQAASRAGRRNYPGRAAQHARQSILRRYPLETCGEGTAFP